MGPHALHNQLHTQSREIHGQSIDGHVGNLVLVLRHANVSHQPTVYISFMAMEEGWTSLGFYWLTGISSCSFDGVHYERKSDPYVFIQPNVSFLLE